MKNLSKGRFIEAMACPLTGWRLRHGEIESIAADDYASQFRAAQGHIIGNLSTTWFDAMLARKGKPPGIDIDNELQRRGITRDAPEIWLQTAIELTQKAMADPSVFAIYEATFNIESYTTRADILARVKPGGRVWNMIEVKSKKSLKPTQKDDKKYITDMAYTTAIMRKIGIPVEKIGLMRIDSSFVLEDISWLRHINDLLDLMTVDTQWQSLVEEEIEELSLPQPPHDLDTWAFIDEITSSEEPPPPSFSVDCRACPSCREHWDNEKECHLILDLPYLGNMREQFNKLVDNEIYCLEDVPDKFFKSKGREPTAAIITQCVKSNKMYVSNTLGGKLCTNFAGDAEFTNQLGPIKWPCLYLDFEFLGTAVPLYVGTKPYQRIPFQYSIHKAIPTFMGNTISQNYLYGPMLDRLEHREYLANPQKDDRKIMAMQLLQDIKELTDPAVPDSTIFVYSAQAERGCIEALASMYDEDSPEIAGQLRHINSRMIDLLEIIRGKKEGKKPASPNIYHPEFRGKFGLKNVINTFAPDLYANLNIKSGDAALAAYGELVYAHRLPELSPWNLGNFNQEQIFADLRQYCNLDTYSLALLHFQMALFSLICPNCISQNDIRYGDKNFQLCGDCLTMMEPAQLKNHSLFCKGFKKRRSARRTKKKPKSPKEETKEERTRKLLELLGDDSTIDDW